jgi:hypothetical protein
MAQRSPLPSAPYAYTTTDGTTHYLHGKTVVSPDGQRRWIYWFARRPKVSQVVTDVPPGYRVAESPLTRRPYLRKR